MLGSTDPTPDLLFRVGLGMVSLRGVGMTWEGGWRVEWKRVWGRDECVLGLGWARLRVCDGQCGGGLSCRSGMGMHVDLFNT